MAVDCKLEGRVLTARVTGEVDHHATRALRQELERQVEACRPRELAMDLSGVDFMDSSGIALLFRVRRLMEEFSGTVRVTGARPQALRVLRAAGLDRLMRFE